MLTYDADTLQRQVAQESIFTHRRGDPLLSGLFNEHLAKFDGNSLNDVRKTQVNIYGKQSVYNAQPLPNNFEYISFYALVKDQSPTSNLEMGVQDKIEPADIYASKYYPLRNNYSDHGHILNLEARIELPVLDEHSHELLQLIVFVDTSPITMEQNTWANDLNHTTINGAGLGIKWTHIDHFVLQVYFANELENQVLALPQTTSNLFWIQAVKYF